MITKDNLKFCFDNLNQDEVEKVMNSNTDYVLFELHVFNAGGFASAEPKEYNEDEEREANDNGQLFIDKDDWLRLFTECESTNQFFNDYI